MNFIQHLKNTLGQAILKTEERQGQEILSVSPEHLRSIVMALKMELAFDLLLDIVAIDWQNRVTPRFEVDYLFYKTEGAQRITLKVPVANDNDPQLDSITDIFSSADWAEREVFDMMGIHFKDHPNLKRLLMWSDFQGHPLRKDYPIQRRQPIPILDDIV
jgi:NADH-quinone oxidoreductase subunit C